MGHEWLLNSEVLSSGLEPQKVAMVRGPLEYAEASTPRALPQTRQALGDLWQGYRGSEHALFGGSLKNSMRQPHPRPKLLPEKLLLIRVHLNVSQRAMQKLLNRSKVSRVSDYERGKRVPNLIILLAYARLGKTTMASLVDDDVSINAFRKQLGGSEHNPATKKHKSSKK